MNVETSWNPPYAAVYSRFYYGFGTLGPFTYSFWSMAPIDEPTNFATLGYLSQDDCIVVNACNTFAQRSVNMTSITPYGSRNQSGVPFLMPEGLDLGFIDDKGVVYDFILNFTTSDYGSTPVGSLTSITGSVGGGANSKEQYTGTGYTLAYVGIGCESLETYQ